ncbi:hypothetical protein C4577_04415 [Candidatus Parcubacteria bacterium]|nr:MAG: hypothetical protein C4577_04415 [Candidatus Parcubacteria bacterium]
MKKILLQFLDYTDFYPLINRKNLTIGLTQVSNYPRNPNIKTLRFSRLKESVISKTLKMFYLNKT